MVWPIRSRISSLLFTNSPLVASHVYESWWFSLFSGPTSSSLTRPWPKVMDWIQIDRCRTAASLPSIKEKQTESPDYCVRLDGENQGTDKGNMSDGYQNLFGLMKQRFMSFKNQKYIEELEHFQVLAEAQSPKFMVIACADSRVCPSNILGFQPGDAFMIRNIANLVPPMKNGPSECNAALQFAVTTLRVENILVIGHSSCAGIETLMNMQDDAESRNFIHKWVANGELAKLKTTAATAHLSFDQQCRFCEKLSLDRR